MEKKFNGDTFSIEFPVCFGLYDKNAPECNETLCDFWKECMKQTNVAEEIESNDSWQEAIEEIIENQVEDIEPANLPRPVEVDYKSKFKYKSLPYVVAYLLFDKKIRDIDTLVKNATKITKANTKNIKTTLYSFKKRLGVRISVMNGRIFVGKDV